MPSSAFRNILSHLYIHHQLILRCLTPPRHNTGMISFSEFLAWYSDDGMTKNLMKVYDADKNGSLNLAEFTCLARVRLPSLLLPYSTVCRG